MNNDQRAPVGETNTPQFGPLVVECVQTSIGRCFRVGTPEMFAQEKSAGRKLPTYACIYDDHSYTMTEDTVTRRFAEYLKNCANDHAFHVLQIALQQRELAQLRSHADKLANALEMFGSCVFPMGVLNHGCEAFAGRREALAQYRSSFKGEARGQEGAQ